METSRFRSHALNSSNIVIYFLDSFIYNSMLLLLDLLILVFLFQAYDVSKEA